MLLSSVLLWLLIDQFIVRKTIPFSHVKHWWNQSRPTSTGTNRESAHRTPHISSLQTLLHSRHIVSKQKQSNKNQEDRNIGERKNGKQKIYSFRQMDFHFEVETGNYCFCLANGTRVPLSYWLTGCIINLAFCLDHSFNNRTTTNVERNVCRQISIQNSLDDHRPFRSSTESTSNKVFSLNTHCSFEHMTNPSTGCDSTSITLKRSTSNDSHRTTGSEYLLLLLIESEFHEWQ